MELADDGFGFTRRDDLVLRKVLTSRTAVTKGMTKKEEERGECRRAQCSKETAAIAGTAALASLKNTPNPSSGFILAPSKGVVKGGTTSPETGSDLLEKRQHTETSVARDTPNIPNVVEYHLKVKPQCLKDTDIQHKVLDDHKPSTSKSKGHSFQTPHVNYPAKLPSLPPQLLKIKENDDVFEFQWEFISFWSTHLQLITNNDPTSTEYDNYCKTIVETFPELKGGNKNNFDVLKTQMTTAIRNRKQLKSNLCEKRQNNSVSASTPTKKIKLSSETDSNEAMAALKKCSVSEESNHVKRLQRETYFQRREWIENKSKNVRDVIKEYPRLQSYTYIIHDFSLLRDKTEISLRDLVDKMIGNVAIFFDIKIETEVHKIQVVQKLHETLMLAKYRKLNEPLITIEEAGKSTTALLTATNSSPRLVVYTSGIKIAEVLVVCDGARVQLAEPDATKATLLLFSVYYVWHCNYPTGYLHTMEYFDYEILGISYHNNSRISKFLCDLDNKLKK
ncbi:uncharacterized protein LOC122500895 isoform X2 [Leptopilina heterotoma]|uniref:uncharacterized protein LOC122500895 isoform X2 n=1 Tax=Leptopilina heterotoma TaxID=63436 RepID=UPI001CA91B3F|nr:uncharacterized protein LOC122500895 isoform X2 [Leptopilina heterotoma]XP_043465980.1 uncharacterized protein LOC122500895 isoform X2 [Leptopilina heterotoma]